MKENYINIICLKHMMKNKICTLMDYLIQLTICEDNIYGRINYYLE